MDAFLDYVDGGRQVAFRPELVTGPAFRGLLRELVGLVARGVFVQEPSACDFCDFTVVCGPKAPAAAPPGDQGPRHRRCRRTCGCRDVG